MSLGGGRQQHITLASRQISLSCRSSLSNAFRGINISGIWSAGLRLFFTCHGIHIELTGKCSDDDCSCSFVEISPTSLFISQSAVFVAESYTVTYIDFPGRQDCKKLGDFIGRRDCSVWNSRSIRPLAWGMLVVLDLPNHGWREASIWILLRAFHLRYIKTLSYAKHKASCCRCKKRSFKCNE